MDAREGRIIVGTMVLGAVAGGVIVWLMRMTRDDSGIAVSPHAASRPVTLEDLFKVGVTGLTLARTIAALGKPSGRVAK